MVSLPLEGLRVIETCEEKGELCGRLLADLGADVIKVEPPGGASSRRLPPFAPDGTTSLWFAVRNSNKRSVELDIEAEPERFQRLLAGADVWLESSAPDTGLDAAAVAVRNPRLVITSITDFGQTGPYRDFVATDPVMVAVSGMLFRSGTADRPPLMTPGTMAYDVASVTAAFATLAALWQREATGRGQHIDLSVMEALAQTTDWALPNYSVVSKQGAYAEVRAGSGFIYPLYPCADGYVRLIVLSPRQWHAFRAWLGEPEILQDEHWDGLLARMSIQADVLDPLYAEFFSDKRMADLADEAQRRGIVMTPVLGPTEILTIPHYKERGTFLTTEVAPGVTGPVVSSFIELDGERAGFRHRAPTVGEHTGDVAGESRDEPAPTAIPAPALPFAGLRVLDFGIGGVGVEVGRLFAEYGADVIKVETRTYPDFIRLVALTEMSASFASSSRCKRSFGANVKNEQGLDAVKRLVGQSDVVIENSTVGTMADMGLDYETMREINPRLVMISSQLMGSTGPWKDWIGYGPSTRPIGGLTYLWNFPGGGMPPGSGAIYPDHLVGRMCTVAAVASLLGRERTGVGVHAEVAQVETVMGLLADIFLQDGLSSGAGQPQGNRSARGVPWGVYQCAGEQRWCAITVRGDADWRNLRTAIGDPAWAADSKYDTAAGRMADQDELDRLLSEWTATRTDREVMEQLQDHGVPAGLMLYSSDMPTDPQLVARGYPQYIEQPGVGDMMLEGPAFHATGIADPLAGPAPGLGEHTREIAAELLGLGDDEIDKLIADGALEGPAA